MKGGHAGVWEKIRGNQCPSWGRSMPGVFREQQSVRLEQSEWGACHAEPCKSLGGTLAFILSTTRSYYRLLSKDIIWLAFLLKCSTEMNFRGTKLEAERSIRMLLQSFRLRNNGTPDLGVCSGGGERLSDSGYILKQSWDFLIGWLALSWQREVKDDSWAFCLSFFSFSTEIKLQAEQVLRGVQTFRWRHQAGP